MTFREFAKDNIVILDGAMGTMLEKDGILPGESPERRNISHPDGIIAIHRAYFDAGSNVVNTNTFGANPLKFDEAELDEIIRAAINNAREAQAETVSEKPTFVALDIGPTGRLIKPFGDLDFNEAVEVFASVVRLGVKYGVDLITVETMNDISETRAALLAVKENSDLPVIVTNAYGEDGKLLTGADATVMAATLTSMGADYIGANCSLGPDLLMPVADRLLELSTVPVVLKPNAGLPEMKDGKAVYNTSPDRFAALLKLAAERGVRFLGGCCGTTPEYIKALSDAIKDMTPCEIKGSLGTVITSYCKSVCLDDGVKLIGERINPTGKKLLREAICSGDIDHLVGIGVSEEELGAHALDVNVGVPGIDEADMLARTVAALQYSVTLPLVIDTSDCRAMEAALRIYAGKAMINSVNGKQESIDKIFPLAKKYGGTLIALTLDESGIPETAEGRVAIAKRIVERAKLYGIDKRDIVFDPLAMTVSADKNAARVTLEAMKRIRYELGCHTSLGISNVSFGLPARDGINAAFFAMAISSGLSAVIMNPASAEMMRTYYSARALMGLDDNFTDYIRVTESFGKVSASASTVITAVSADSETLRDCIVKGLGSRAAELTERLLCSAEPLDIVNNEIIPALDIVGKGFEEGRIYLPSLLLAAETAKSAFSVIKSRMTGSSAKKDGTIVIATVKGDIHDIGKNIVKLLLENYGFSVVDLGKDVSPELIVREACERRAAIVALSALMTTTVPAMEETVRLLHASGSGAKIIVGGAVLTKEHADRLGADAYAKDAMGAVRYAESVIG